MIFEQKYQLINISGRRWLLYSSTTFPATLKTRSDGTLVASKDQTSCRNLEMCGYVVQRCSHHFKGSDSRSNGSSKFVSV